MTTGGETSTRLPSGRLSPDVEVADVLLHRPVECLGVQLPDINGHDMMPVPGSSRLILSTAAHTWFFDRTTHRFTKHPRLGDVGKVKSVHIDPASNRLLWIQGDGTTWWSNVLHFSDPETTITLQGEKVYKVRWMPAGREFPRER